MSIQAAFEQRFWAKIEPAGVEECWNWTSVLTYAGYGQITIPGHRVARAHRVAFELLICEIPEGLQLDHLCRNRRCVNPWHLEPVNGRVNTMRGTSFAAVNAAKTHCDNGHPFDEANTRWYKTKRGAPARTCRKCSNAFSKAYKARKAAAA